MEIMSLPLNKKIILVEDDQDHVELMTMILSSDGYQVKESHPMLLQKHIEQEEPCLILMDNWLNQDSGAKICKALKTDKRFKHIPVVLISAASGLKEIATNSAADGYI